MHKRKKFCWHPFISHLSVSSILITFLISLITTTTTSLYAQEKPPEVKLTTEQLAVEKLPLKAELTNKVHIKPQVEMERIRFRALIIANPNYFGNIKESPFKPVLDIQGNTKYEEICSVGFQPQLSQLEAVVYVKQPLGYGGDVCSKATKEYVRFYVSFDNKATWQDMGVASFTAYNIPGTKPKKPLEYAVIKQVKLPKKLCKVSNLIHARAILSWNVPPPANNPDFTPVWGEVHDTHIQIDKRELWVLKDLVKELEFKPQIPPEQLELLDLAQPIVTAKPKVLGALELQALYKDKGVEPHRFALPELQQLISEPTLGASLMAPGFKGVFLGLDIDLLEIIGKLFPVDGNTRYEELDCIGLDPNQDTLVGVIRVKLPGGYSGNFCSAGSKEYVTFWADFDNDGTFEACLGTTSVTVHDFKKIPKEGLEYAVALPVDLNSHRQKCTKGPKVVKIRAILSWQIKPPCFNPNYIPIWGNREETLIHIKPGRRHPDDTHPPIIQTVGSMDVDDINGATGLANGLAVLAGFTAEDSPFGGWIIMTGHIANPPDISQGATHLKYKVELSNDGGSTWTQHLSNTFTLGRDQLLNAIWSDLPSATQSVDGDGWYEYQEDLIGDGTNPKIFPVGNLLARWQTGGLTGLWKIRIKAKNPDIVGPVWISDDVTVMLDNTAPTVSITITSGGGACADFLIGDVISGTYAVSDEHFGSLRFSVLPALGGSFTNPAPLPAGPTMPLRRTFAGGVPTIGEAGNWSLDTTGMPRCGYVIELWAWDRTIRNSGFIGFGDRVVVGLCLRETTE